MTQLSIKSFKFDKLIRDHVYQMIADQGLTFQSEELSNCNYKQALLQKLNKEVNEVYTAQGPDALIKKLADVLEVIHNLVLSMDSFMQDLEEVRIQKF